LQPDLPAKKKNPVWPLSVCRCRLSVGCRRQFRGNVGSDGFEKVLIGTRGARETFLDVAKVRAAKNSVLTERRKTA